MQPNESRFAIPRTLQFALFATGLVWLLAASSASQHAAQGIANRLNLAVLQPLLNDAFYLFLLLTGLATLSWIATRAGGIRTTNALPERATAAQEWSVGAALGWAMLLAAVLPMALVGDLHPHFWLAPRSWGLALISLATLALGTLAIEVGFRGYIYRRLTAALGPVASTLLLSAIYALFASFRPQATALSVTVTFVTGILFSIAYLRTHALWLGWGLHFAWDAAMGVLFGLPVGGLATYTSLVDTTSTGRLWVTGGDYGPEGATFTLIVVLAAMAVLYRLTRDYAWNYTHAPIVAAAYAAIVAPPAAHTAMEQEAARPAPLVQILGATPSSPSTLPAIEEHLRSGRDSATSD